MFLHSAENVQVISPNGKHNLHQSLPGLWKHYEVIALFTKDNEKGAKGKKGWRRSKQREGLMNKLN